MLEFPGYKKYKKIISGIKLVFYSSMNTHVVFRQPVQYIVLSPYISNWVQHFFSFLKTAPTNKNIFSPLLIKAVSYALKQATFRNRSVYVFFDHVQIKLVSEYISLRFSSPLLSSGTQTTSFTLPFVFCSPVTYCCHWYTTALCYSSVWTQIGKISLFSTVSCLHSRFTR